MRIPCSKKCLCLPVCKSKCLVHCADLMDYINSRYENFEEPITELKRKRIWKRVYEYLPNCNNVYEDTDKALSGVTLTTPFKLKVKMR